MAGKYDSTVARIAGNIASGLITRGTYDGDPDKLVEHAVSLARQVVAETKRTEPAPPACELCSGVGKIWTHGQTFDCSNCGGRGHL